MDNRPVTVIKDESGTVISVTRGSGFVNTTKNSTQTTYDGSSGNASKLVGKDVNLVSSNNSLDVNATLATQIEIQRQREQAAQVEAQRVENSRMAFAQQAFNELRSGRNVTLTYDVQSGATGYVAKGTVSQFVEYEVPGVLGSRISGMSTAEKSMQPIATAVDQSLIYGRVPQTSYTQASYITENDRDRRLYDGSDTRLSTNSLSNIPSDQENILTVKEVVYRDWFEKQIATAKTNLDRYSISNPVIGSLSAAPLGIASSFYNTGRFGIDLITNPTGTIKSIALGTVNIIRNPKETFNSIIEDISSSPGFYIGQFGGDLLTGKILLTSANKATLIYRSATAPLRAGGEVVPIEQVSDLGVLAGDKFPTSVNTQAAFNDFLEGMQPDNTLLSTNVRPIGISEKIPVGPAGAAAAEDAVLFTAPYDRASTHFLRLSGVDYSGFTLNPLAVTNPFAADPTINIIRSSGIRQIPQSVIDTASKGDFVKVNEFLTTQADKSYIYQTARSSLGFTSEAEAGVIAGTPAKVYKPFAYVEYEGSNIPVRLVDITDSNKAATNVLEEYRAVEDVEKLLQQSSFSRPGKYGPIATPTTSMSDTSNKRISANVSTNSISSYYEQPVSAYYKSASSATSYSGDIKRVPASYPNSTSKSGSQSPITSYANYTNNSQETSYISYPQNAPFTSTKFGFDYGVIIEDAKEVKFKPMKGKDDPLGYSPSAFAVSENIRGKVTRADLEGVGIRPIPETKLKLKVKDGEVVVDNSKGRRKKIFNPGNFNVLGDL